MVPTLYHGDVVLAEKISPLLDRLCKGDVVIVRSPVRPREILGKRIAATSGQKVADNQVVNSLPI